MVSASMSTGAVPRKQNLSIEMGALLGAAEVNTRRMYLYHTILLEMHQRESWAIRVCGTPPVA